MKTLLLMTAVTLMAGCSLLNESAKARVTCEKHGNTWSGIPASQQHMCQRNGWDKLSERDPPQDFFDKQKKALREQLSA